jgi:hypothetical protein
MIGFGYGYWKRVIWRSGGTSEAASGDSYVPTYHIYGF